MTDTDDRQYVTFKRQPRKGDTLMLHGRRRVVSAVRKGRVYFNDEALKSEWYWVGSLILVKAYFV